MTLFGSASGRGSTSAVTEKHTAEAGTMILESLVDLLVMNENQKKKNSCVIRWSVSSRWNGKGWTRKTVQTTSRSQLVQRAVVYIRLYIMCYLKNVMEIVIRWRFSFVSKELCEWWVCSSQGLSDSCHRPRWCVVTLQGRWGRRRRHTVGDAGRVQPLIPEVFY